MVVAEHARQSLFHQGQRGWRNNRHFGDQVEYRQQNKEKQGLLWCHEKAFVLKVFVSTIDEKVSMTVIR